jgi:hypothetical protein
MTQMDGSRANIAPLALFWWKAVPNFGDALSALVVAHVSGRPVTHAGPGACELFAAGSILQVARRKLDTPRPDGVKPWIWGSGLLAPIKGDFLANANVAILRGPVTAALLGVQTDRFGDPGLLVPEALGATPTRIDRIGVVPHHTQLDDPAVAALLASDPVFELIDVRDDATSVCRQIAACRHVVSSSLHGLVVADAYGVASTWADPGTQSRLKYIDYAASIGRDMAAPVAWADVPAAVRRTGDGPLPHADGVARAVHDLKTEFPAPLRAAPDTLCT